jgi:hypothetical protein
LGHSGDGFRVRRLGVVQGDDAKSGRGLSLLAVYGVLDVNEGLSAAREQAVARRVRAPGPPTPGLGEAQRQSAARLRKIARSLSFWVRAAAFSNS